MRALSKNKAIKEFYRQDKEWKDYYKRGKPIVCPQEERSVAETEKQRYDSSGYSNNRTH